MFVVITLGAERGDEGLLRTFLTPTLVRFGVVMLIALLALSPKGDNLILPPGLVDFTGLICTLSIAVKAARDDRLLSDVWLFHMAAFRSSVMWELSRPLGLA